MDSKSNGGSNGSNGGTKPNYMEFYLLNETNGKDGTEGKDENNGNVFDISVDENKINNILNNILKRKKYIKKEFKVYKNKDLILENYENKCIKVYKLKSVKHEVQSKKILKLEYEKQKENYHTFPCTSNLDSVYHVKRITFKINDCIFLNFDSEIYSEKESVHKIFINYNIDINKDSTFFEKELEKNIKTYLLDI